MVPPQNTGRQHEGERDEGIYGEMHLFLPHWCSFSRWMYGNGM